MAAVAATLTVANAGDTLDDATDGAADTEDAGDGEWLWHAAAEHSGTAVGSPPADDDAVC